MLSCSFACFLLPLWLPGSQKAQAPALLKVLSLYFQCPEAQLKVPLSSLNPSLERIYFFLLYLVCSPVGSAFSFTRTKCWVNPLTFQKIGAFLLLCWFSDLPLTRPRDLLSFPKGDVCPTIKQTESVSLQGHCGA